MVLKLLSKILDKAKRWMVLLIIPKKCSSLASTICTVHHIAILKVHTSILYYLTGMNTQLWEMDGWTIFTNCCNWTIEFVPPVWKCLLWITIYQDVGRKSFAWLLTARCCIIWSKSKLLFGLDLVLFYSTWVLLYPAWIKDIILSNLD